jgi:hypothetical protein
MAPHLMGYVKQETGKFNSSLIVIALARIRLRCDWRFLRMRVRCQK